MQLEAIDQSPALTAMVTPLLDDGASCDAQPPVAVPSVPELFVFPWYYLLAVRLVCTVLGVIFIQTAFNCAYIFYNQFWDEFTGHGGQERLSEIDQTFKQEVDQRSTSAWQQSLSAGWHQLMTQIALFL